MLALREPVETAHLIAVITTIQGPTDSVRALASRLGEVGATALIVGDAKGPVRYELPNTELITLEDQRGLPFTLERLLPTHHYARKNLGYLVAASRHAPCIYETDDDNAPNDVWQMRAVGTDAQRLAPRSWVNVFRLFTQETIWPRGFPLELVSDASTYSHDRAAAREHVKAPIQQGLADNSPDVDAVWRLVMDRPITFDSGPSVWLAPGSWCPFNSQSTWWWPAAYPLMYLPSHASFRMTDIWRSFVAQRCLWELGHGVVFHASEVVQDRNPHDLSKDFEHEVPGYLYNRRIAEELAALKLRPGEGAAGENLLRCYEALVAGGYLPAAELDGVRAWLADLRSCA
jgi:STELLO glycosyltransferases